MMPRAHPARFVVAFLALLVNALAVRAAAAEEAPAASEGATPLPAIRADASTPASSEGVIPWMASRTTPLSAGAPASSGSGWRAALILLVVGALGGLAYYMKKRRAGTGAAGKGVEVCVLGCAKVGPKAQAVVTKVGGRTLLLGVTERSVRRLAWLDGEGPESTVQEGHQPDLGLDRRDDLRDALAGLPPANDTAGVHGAADSPPLRRPAFRDIMRSVLKNGGRAGADSRDAAVQIAEATRDVVVSSEPPRDTHVQRRPMVSVEEQAAGLAERLVQSRVTGRRASGS